jgi:tetratricopeptide (TPR) repeat protein
MQAGTSTHKQSAAADPSLNLPLASEVESQLETMLRSPVFSGSRRHSRFLEFVVRKALADEAESIKEYLIALEVFERSADFDPSSDPVVRSEARRLRARLNEYYSGIGLHDPVHIELPKGTYVPVFSRNGGARQEPESVVQSEAARPEDPPDDAQLPTAEPARKRAWLVLSLVGLLAIASVLYGVHLRKQQRAAASAAVIAEKPIVIADFANTTGDSVFDRTLRQATMSQLEQSPYLNLLSDTRVQQTLSLMTQPQDVMLTPALAREVCLRAGGAAVLEGSIAPKAQGYSIALGAVDCNDGSTLAHVEANAEGRNQVIPATDLAARDLRLHLGESLSSIQKYDVPLETVTTSSLEALQAYTLATRAKQVWGDFTTAVPLFQRAIALDTNFAIAYAQLGTIYNGPPPGSAEYLTRAFQLRDRASLPERFYIDSHYHHLVTRDLAAAQSVYEQWQQVYPHDANPAGNLGQIYGLLGYHEKALQAFQNTVKLSPDGGLQRANLVLGYLELNRLDEAEAAAQEAKARKLDVPLVHVNLYLIDVVRGDLAAAEREVAYLTAQPGWEPHILAFEADSAAQRGQLRKAQELSRRAADFAGRNGNKDDAAYVYQRAACVSMLVEDGVTARKDLQSATAFSNADSVSQALALAMTGDEPHAGQMLDRLSRIAPRDTLLQATYVPGVQAAMALAKHEPGKAVKALAPMAPYELSDELYIGLLGIYFRGMAYLAQHDGPAAATEFQKIIEQRGLCGNSVVCALARLQLGRAYALAGDKQRARNSYQDFFALWKDADADVPILVAAKAEYTRLR